MPHIRFSLMTLILATVAIGAGIGLWHRGRAPWKKIRSYEVGPRPSGFRLDVGYNAAVSSNGLWLASLNMDGRLRLFVVSSL